MCGITLEPDTFHVWITIDGDGKGRPASSKGARSRDETSQGEIENCVDRGGGKANEVQEGMAETKGQQSGTEGLTREREEVDEGKVDENEVEGEEKGIGKAQGTRDHTVDGSQQLKVACSMLN